MQTAAKDTDRSFGKAEKLCRTKSIDRLFAQGKSFIAYPLRIVYFAEDEVDMQQQYASVLVSVSKKKFKRAVKRNRVKRLIKEAYRLNKQQFTVTLQANGKKTDLAFLYLKNELPDYTEIEKAILKAAAQLQIHLSEKKEDGE